MQTLTDIFDSIIDTCDRLYIPVSKSRYLVFTVRESTDKDRMLVYYTYCSSNKVSICNTYIDNVYGDELVSNMNCNLECRTIKKDDGEIIRILSTLLANTEYDLFLNRMLGLYNRRFIKRLFYKQLLIIAMNNEPLEYSVFFKKLVNVVLTTILTKIDSIRKEYKISLLDKLMGRF